MQGLKNRDRQEIFKQFLTENKLKFSEIEKQLNLRSNMLAYHLEILQKDNILIKENDCYKLTKKAESLIPDFSKEKSALPIVLLIVRNQERILLMNRNKRPYKDLWGLIGGRLLYHESLEEASLRVLKTKTGLSGNYLGNNSVVQEHITDDEKIKHGFLLVVTTIETNEDFKETEHGELGWFSADELPENMIPSDLWLVKNKTEMSPMIQFSVVEKDGKIIQ